MRCEKCGAYVDYGEHLCEVCKCMDKIMSNPQSMYKEEDKFEIIDLDDAISNTLDLTLPTTEAMKKASSPKKEKEKLNISFNKSKLSFATASFSIVFCLVLGSIGYSLSFSSPKNILTNLVNMLFEDINQNLYIDNNSKVTFNFSSNISNINDEYYDFYNLFNSTRINGEFYSNYDTNNYKLEYDYKYKNYDEEHIDTYIISDEVYLLNSKITNEYVHMNNNKNLLDKYVYNSNNKKLLDALQFSLNEFIKDLEFEEEDVILTVNKKDILTKKMTTFISEDSIEKVKHNYYKYIKKYSLYSELSKNLNTSLDETKRIVSKHISDYESSTFDTKLIYYISLYADKDENKVVKLEVGTTDLYDSKIIEMVHEKEDIYKIKYIKNNKLFLSGNISVKEKSNTNYINIDLIDLEKNTLVFNISYKIENGKTFDIKNFSTTEYSSLDEESKDKLINKQMIDDIDNVIFER